MKKVSIFALALMAGAGAMTVSAPALAQKKKKGEAAAPAGPSFQLGKEFRAAIAPAQVAIKAGDFATGEAAITAAEAVATHPDEKYIAAAIRLDMATQKKDAPGQAKALDAILASGGAPTADVGKFNFFSGQFAYQAGDYPKAVQRLTEAERLGYKNNDALLLLAEANFKQNNVPAGLVFVDKAIAASQAAGTKAPEAWYQRAASVSYKAKLNSEVAKWTAAQVRAYPTAENWRSALVTYRDAARLEGQQQLDLMRLMRLTKSLAGERDFYEFASLATDRALPGEAKSTIEEGFASGAVQRTSKPVNEILAIANGKIAADKASLASSEKAAGSAANGRSAKGTGDGYLGYGDDTKAIAMYRLALQKGGVDSDEVNTRLGIALARSGQKDEARKAFAAVTTGARADIARFWTLYLDTSV